MNAALILLLWLAGVSLIALELFVPGAVAGVLGLCLTAAAVVVMFVQEGAAAGLGLAAGSGLALALAWRVGLARLRHRGALDVSAGYVGTDDLSALMGQSGEALTPLRPGGFARIGGQRVDVISEGEHLAQGVPVVVVRVEGSTVTVRRAARDAGAGARA